MPIRRLAGFLRDVFYQYGGERRLEINADIVFAHDGEHLQEVGGVDADGGVFSLDGGGDLQRPGADLGIAGRYLQSRIRIKSQAGIEIIFPSDEIRALQSIDQILPTDDSFGGV